MGIRADGPSFYGTREHGGTVRRAHREDAPDGGWRWAGTRRAERMEGVADDKTNALVALWHFLDPDGSLDTD